MKINLRIKTPIIIAANVLLVLAIAGHSMLLEVSAWLLWIAVLFLEIKSDRKNKIKISIYRVIIILIICYITSPLWRRLFT